MDNLHQLICCGKKCFQHLLCNFELNNFHYFSAFIKVTILKPGVLLVILLSVNIFNILLHNRSRAIFLETKYQVLFILIEENLPFINCLAYR